MQTDKQPVLSNSDISHFQQQFKKIKENLEACKNNINNALDQMVETTKAAVDFCVSALQYTQERIQDTDSKIPLPTVSLPDSQSEDTSKLQYKDQLNVFDTDLKLSKLELAQLAKLKTLYPYGFTIQPRMPIDANQQLFQTYLSAYLSGHPIPIDNYNNDQILYIRDQFILHNYRLPQDLESYIEVLKNTGILNYPDPLSVPSCPSTSMSNHKSNSSSNSSTTSTTATTTAPSSTTSGASSVSSPPTTTEGNKSLVQKKSVSSQKKSDFLLYNEKRPRLEKLEDLVVPENTPYKKYILYYKNHKTIYLESEDIEEIEQIKSAFLSLGIRDSSIWYNIYVNTFFPNSSILSNDQAFYVSNWCGPKKQWKLAYKYVFFVVEGLVNRGTRDGFLSADFHKKCDNKGESVTFYKYYVNGVFCVFGGYTSIPWTSGIRSWSIPQSLDDQHYSDPNTFVFTLSNPNNVPPTQFPCIVKSKNIYHGRHLGANFGGTYNNMGICGAYKFDVPPAIQPQMNKISTLAIIANSRFYSFINFNPENPTYGDLAGYGNGLFVSQKKTWDHISFTSNEIETYIRLDA